MYWKLPVEKQSWDYFPQVPICQECQIIISDTKGTRV